MSHSHTIFELTKNVTVPSAVKCFVSSGESVGAASLSNKFMTNVSCEVVSFKT